MTRVAHNPQGFWRVGVGVGVRVGIFYPPKTPTLVEGMEGYRAVARGIVYYSIICISF